MSDTPVIDYVLLELERGGELLTKSERAALLSIGVRGERDTRRGCGYDLTYPDLVAKDIGLALSTTRRVLNRLVELELLVGVVLRGGGREYVRGKRGGRTAGAIFLGYRVPEEAFNR